MVRVSLPGGATRPRAGVVSFPGAARVLRSRVWFVLLLAACLLTPGVVLPGCAPPLSLGPPNGNFDPGVTTGGTKDMAYARQIIERGEVPDPEAVTVEGMLSEHDIPVEEPPGSPVLYNTVTTAWNQDFDALTPLATVAIGLGTTLDAGEFQREPQNLCLVIDRSGSMEDPIDELSGTTKLEAVKIAIDRLVANLTSSDRISVVSFNDSARVDLAPTAGNNLAAVKTALDKISAKGATDLHAGMGRGYRLIDANGVGGLAERILVFTDALPTDGPGGTQSFIDLMEAYADENIGASIFGVGLDFGEELAQDIAQVRGANFFFLSDYERIVTVFDEEFDYLVTPIAYDVDLSASIDFAWDVSDVHGLPGAGPPTHALELTIPTLFFSTREGGGAILVRLRPGATVDFSQAILAGQVRLSYSNKDGTFTTITRPIELPAELDPDAAEAYFPNAAAQRSVLLLNTALAIQASCEDVYPQYGWYDWYVPDDNDVNRATDRLRRFLAYFDTLAAGLDDRVSERSRGLSDERALIEKLLANIEGLSAPVQD